MTKPEAPLDKEIYPIPNDGGPIFFPIKTFANPYENKEKLSLLIQSNIKELDVGQKTLLATYRRLEDLAKHYSQEGNKLFFINDESNSFPIACIGLGSFSGLPASEKIGEIRDLVVHKEFRHQGYGRKLLKHGIKEAQKFSYKRLYLETTKDMTGAQKLFVKSGFEPVEELPKKDEAKETLPYYYLLKDLDLKALA